MNSSDASALHSSSKLQSAADSQLVAYYERLDIGTYGFPLQKKPQISVTFNQVCEGQQSALAV